MIKIVKFSTLFFIFLFSITLTNGQIGNIGSFLTGSSSDADKLFSAYLKPYANGFGADLNNGWYNTAKPHKLLGFDLTLSGSLAFVPVADQNFNVNNLNLAGTVAPGSNGFISPTVAGSKGTNGNPQITEYLNVAGNNTPAAQFNMPNGTGIGFVPVPMLKLGIGLVKGTEIDLRYIPNIGLGNVGSVQLWGIGLKHSIKQWIPGLSLAPFFHLSIFGGYTQFTTNVNLNFPASKYNNLNPAPQPVDTLPFGNQKFEMKVSSFTADVIASFDLPIITFYGSAGINTSETSLALDGNYPLPSVQNDKIVLIHGINPLSVNLNSSVTPRLNLGIKFTFAVITLHFDYTFATYSVFTAGLGLSFR